MRNIAEGGSRRSGELITGPLFVFALVGAITSLKVTTAVASGQGGQEVAREELKTTGDIETAVNDAYSMLELIPSATRRMRELDHDDGMKADGQLCGIEAVIEAAQVILLDVTEALDRLPTKTTPTTPAPLAAEGKAS